GVDLQLRLRVDYRAAAVDQIATQLMRVDLLRVLAHRDLALKSAVRPAGGNALDQLPGLPVRHLVIDIRDDVRLFGAVDDEGAIEMTLRPLAGHPYAGLVPYRAAAEQQRNTAEPRIGAERRIDLAEMHGIGRFLDQHGTIQLRSGGEPHRDDIV